METVMGRQRGPVELLCNEIGFRFRQSMETVQTLRAFTQVLVGEIEEMRHFAAAISDLTGTTPSAESAEAIARASEMLTFAGRDQLIAVAATVHAFCNEANPEGKYPTDHYIDMVSSCTSILRFGLETPCHSRHAASAMEHVWRLKYGVKLHDRHTSNWANDWGRSVLESALLLQIPLPPPPHREGK
jgi:hypothetical protein